jgi:hypothetical protein
MGQGFGAVFPIVVVGIVANLLVNAFLGFEIVLAGLLGGLHSGGGPMGGLEFRWLGGG